MKHYIEFSEAEYWDWGYSSKWFHKRDGGLMVSRDDRYVCTICNYTIFPWKFPPMKCTSFGNLSKKKQAVALAEML